MKKENTKHNSQKNKSEKEYFLDDDLDIEGEAPSTQTNDQEDCESCKL